MIRSIHPIRARRCSIAASTPTESEFGEIPIMLDFGVLQGMCALSNSQLPEEPFDDNDYSVDIGDFPITLFGKDRTSKVSLKLSLAPVKTSRPVKYLRSTSDSLVPRDTYDPVDTRLSPSTPVASGHKHSFSSSDSTSSSFDDCPTLTSEDPSPPFRLSSLKRSPNMSKGHKPNSPSQNLRRRAHLRRAMMDLSSSKENFEEDFPFGSNMDEEGTETALEPPKCSGPEILPIRPLTVKKVVKQDVRPDSFFWSPLTPTKDGFDALPLPRLPRLSVDATPIDWSLIESQLGCMSLDPIAELAYAHSDESAIPSQGSLPPIPPPKDSTKFNLPPSSAAKRKGIIGAPTKRI